MPRPSLTLILSGVFILYILNGIWSIAQLFIAPGCNVENEVCFDSYLTSKPALQLLYYTSTTVQPKSDNTFLIYNDATFDVFNPLEKEIQIDIPNKTLQNGTLYLHIALVGFKKNGKPLVNPKWNQLHYEKEVSFGKVPLTKFAIPQATVFNLLGETKENQSSAVQKPVTHIRSKVTFNVFTDLVKLPAQNLPGELARLLILNKKRDYLPIIQYNFLQTRLKDLVELKPVNNTVNVTIAYAPIGIGKLRLLVQMHAAVTQMYTLGFTEKDVDSIKEIFADTSIYLLCVTVMIGCVHLLFDVLAFKNDVSFWRNRKSLAGLSPRTVIWRSFSHAVVFLYLLDENTSFLVLVPSAVGTLIEFWKTTKIFKIKLLLGFPCIKFSLRATNDEERLTQKHDAECMRYLSYLLYPLCFLGALYSLIYEPHRSWYSWTVHSIVNGVYAFGFLFMLPQLFVNYRLKSVAALPWRAFTYKAFNTFIDDIFAFIITMPTAHRVACFRDDIIFVIYLYQRWLYPVDSTRIDDADPTPEMKEITKETKKIK